MLVGLSSMAGFADGTGSGTGGTGGSFWIEISDGSVSKTGGSSGADRTLTTQHVTITPHGGVGSPVYSWVRTSGDASITADNPSAASTSFSATLSVGDEVTADFRCTVTDGSGAVQTADVTVTIALIDYGSTL